MGTSEVIWSAFLVWFSLVQKAMRRNTELHIRCTPVVVCMACFPYTMGEIPSTSTLEHIHNVKDRTDTYNKSHPVRAGELER